MGAALELFAGEGVRASLLPAGSVELFTAFEGDSACGFFTGPVVGPVVVACEVGFDLDGVLSFLKKLLNSPLRFWSFCSDPGILSMDSFGVGCDAWRREKRRRGVRVGVRSSVDDLAFDEDAAACLVGVVVTGVAPVLELGAEGLGCV